MNFFFYPKHAHALMHAWVHMYNLGTTHILISKYKWSKIVLESRSWTLKNLIVSSVQLKILQLANSYLSKNEVRFKEQRSGKQWVHIQAIKWKEEEESPYYNIQNQYAINQTDGITELTYFSSSDLSRLFSSTCQKKHVALLISYLEGNDMKEATISLYQSEPTTATVWNSNVLLLRAE